MFFTFLKTNTGIALLAALVFIGSALAIKAKQSNTSASAQVSLIADASVKKGIENGEIASNWEEMLKSITASSTNNDKIATLIAESSSTAPENLTPTDRFARNFFTKYIDLKRSGATIDENTGMSLINQLLAEDYNTGPGQKTYTESDIKVRNAVSADILKLYGNSLGAILKTPIPRGYEQELTLISRVNESGKVEDLKKLDLNIRRYQTIQSGLVTLPVPNGLKNAHLALINAFSAIIDGINGMMVIQTDPVTATKMLYRYQDGVSALDVAIVSIESYFKKQNISFSPSESGYILSR